MKEGKWRGEGVWSASSNVVFEASLISLDGEPYVFVEVNVAARSDVDIVALLFVRVSFHFLMVVECLSLLSFSPWSCRFDAEAFQKFFDVFEESVVSIVDTDVSFLAD
jgi:hypothetical protein